jgi:hypothetical protein
MPWLGPEWLDRLADEQGLGRPPSLPAGKSMTLLATDQELTDNSWTVLGGSAGLQRAGGHPAGADVSVHGDTELWRSWLALTPL